MNTTRCRIEDLDELPLAFATAKILDHTKLRSPAARERAERRKGSQKRQKALRDRREAPQRKAGRRRDGAA